MMRNYWAAVKTLPHHFQTRIRPGLLNANGNIRCHRSKTAQLEPSALQTIRAVTSKFSNVSTSIGERPFSRS